MAKIVRVVVGFLLSAAVLMPAAFIAFVALPDLYRDDAYPTPTQQLLPFLIVIGVALALLIIIWSLVLRANSAKPPKGKPNSSAKVSSDDSKVWPPPPRPQ